MSTINSDVDEFNRLSNEIIGAAIEVHRTLGPGLLESAYESCLSWELHQRGFDVETQVPVPIRYKEITLDVGYRIDLLVERKLLLELKSIDMVLHTYRPSLDLSENDGTQNGIDTQFQRTVDAVRNQENS